MDAQLVGRRVEALWGDPDAEEAEQQWYSATIVHMRPRARDFTLHFDDGLVEPGIKLPDDSIRLLEEVVPVCSCARCCADDSEGRALPIACEPKWRWAARKETRAQRRRPHRLAASDNSKRGNGHTTMAC